MTFARSVDPIVSMEHALTVWAARDEEKKYESQVGIQGRKATVPYGLYVCHGFVSANLAKQTGFSEDDLKLFWEALKNMFDVDRSAARGLMSAQKLIVFKHNSVLGNAPANKLFERVKVEKKCEDAPRSFKDYKVTIDKNNLPEGVSVEEMI
jgi:CRISPR-associated protein Csd2